MSMTEAPPLAFPVPEAASEAPARTRSTRSAFAWEAAKTAVAVATFTAMFLPLAFPSKAGTQVRPVAASSPVAEAPVLPSVAAKPSVQKAAVAQPAKPSAVPQPAKKPKVS